MKLNRLILRDFGLYRGQQEILLAPRPRHGKPRPVVVVGGHNGAGKTTILEAIRLCLYGKLALGSRVREQDYSEYLQERIHRDRTARDPANSASVAIDFDYARGAISHNYLVERSWQAVQGRVTENLSILLDGRPLEEIDSEFWPDFLRSLVPPGLSQLFFFDGEKIQKLAEDATDTVTLAESVKALLGLDLVERLQADLDLYLSRQARKGNAADQVVRLPALQKEVEELEKQVAQLRQEEAQCRNQFEYAEKEVERVEQLLAVGGHGLADKRVELKQRIARLSARGDEIARHVRDLCDGPLPLAACPTLAAKLVQQLELEAEADRWRAARGEVDRTLEAVSERVLAPKHLRKLGIDDAARRNLSDALAQLRAEVTTAPASLEGFAVLHGVSPREREEINRSIVQATTESKQAVNRSCTELLKIEQQLALLQVKLNKAPESDEIAPRIRELGALHSDETNARVAYAQKETERLAAEKRLAALQRERKRLQETLALSGKAGKKWELAQRTRGALDEYLTRLTSVKVEELEKVTTSCFAELCRKTSLIKSIHINPATFAIELKDFNGRRMPKSDLSAGEKQLYAISVLWGLAKVSGRPLPMIIDTPLGRLDSVHRAKLIDNYFPKASHQVVVLSTDTEVDAAHFESLRPYMSHAIHLAHNEEGWTKATPGYFWKENQNSGAATGKTNSLQQRG